jgi:tetratricopeptide (TPR) repeat protein
MVKEALADHEKALDLEPYNVRGQFNLGRLLFELKRFDEAVDHLQKGKLLFCRQSGRM